MNTRTATPAFRQRGAALLMAMIILTLVATLSIGMVYQQHRAIQVETADRARDQAASIAAGALELARWVLRKDGMDNKNNTDHLGEAWATPLPETDLTSLISADDRSPTAQQGLRAFVRGQIIDAQSRFNLRSLIVDDPQQQGKKIISASGLATLATLCADVGVAPEVAQKIATGLLGAETAGNTIPADAMVVPTRMSQLTWFGLEPKVIDLLRANVDVLPKSVTKINVNTASAEVLAAAIPGLTRGDAQLIIEERRRRASSASNDGLKGDTDVKAMFPKLQTTPLDNLSGSTNYFEVRAELRIGDQFSREIWLLRRDQNSNNPKVTVVRRERIGGWAAPS